MARVRNPIIWSHVKANRRRRSSDINMTPIMNLFVLLIPFLLMSATFVEFSIVHSSLSEEAAGSGKEVKAGLILEIDSKGYQLVSRTCDLDHVFKHGKVRAGKSRIPIPGHNRETLLTLLKKLKNAFPQEKEISLAPESETPYQLVIHTMDRVREYRTAHTIQPLFPNIAFIRLKRGQKR